MTNRIEHHGGAGFHSTGQDSDRQREERRRRFAARYAPGDIVYGAPLRPGPGNLTWVDIGGHSLLADIGTAAKSLYCFQVERVDPEIVLKLFHGDPHSRPGRPERAAQLYNAARSAMERHLATEFWPQASSLSTAEARIAFLGHLRTSSKAAELAAMVSGGAALLAPLLARFSALNQLAAARLVHLPWLDSQCTALDCLVQLYPDSIVQFSSPLPDAQSAYALDPESLAVQDGLHARLTYGAIHPTIGRLVCELAFPGARARMRVEKPDALRTLALDNGAYPLLPSGSTLDEIAPLPPYAQAPLDAVLAVVSASRLRKTI